jgi:hypothetical protein
MEEDKIIKINDCICFNKESCCFFLTRDTVETIYRTKNVICSYSGANEWAHHFVCEMIDL